MKDINKIKPYKDSQKDKKNQVAEMFDNIAPKYDFLNHFLSLNIDKIWRRKAIRLLKPSNPKLLLDIATGTGDFAITAVKKLNPDKIIGIDISKGMLEIGKKKIQKKNLANTITFQEGDSEKINFDNLYFDAATVAFGVRNFANLDKGLSEIYRVLKQQGKVVILEFSQPDKFPLKQLYNLYFKTFLPFTGKLFSKDKSAYTYLPESVGAFPYGNKFIEHLTKAGFKNSSFKKLSGGIAMIYYAEK